MSQCVVSNGTVVAQTKKLTRSGLGALMDGVFLSEQLGAEKPKRSFSTRSSPPSDRSRRARR
ncbi:MAG: hypothetical protein ACLTG0_14100 [Oscillibacter sp.]